MESLTERFKKSGISRDLSKQFRLSKASIGQPIERNEHERPSSDVSDGVDSAPSMAMKCISLQKDGKSYGLTVGGDNPVYVQSVKEDGAAAKAGVMQGDRILKVNGERVTNMNHLEVVKLIKADDFVLLTLLGLPSTNYNNASTSSDTGSASSLNNSSDFKVTQQTSNKLAIYDQKVQTIKQMLEQENAEVERIKNEYSKNPDPKILKNLVQAQKLQEDLKKQMWKVENSQRQMQEAQSNNTTAPANANEVEVDGLFSKSQPIEDEVSLMTMDYSDDVTDEKYHSSDVHKQSRAHKINDVIYTGQSENNSEQPTVMVVDEDKATMDLLREFQPNNPFMNSALMGGGENGKAATHQQNAQIMNFEDDDDIVAECDADHGAFNDLDTMKQKPAYLAVFFNYVIGSKEPAEFLLTLAVDSLKQLTNTKEMVKAADTIYKTYIASNAPYRVVVDARISQHIQSLIGSKNPSEDSVRGVFDSAVQIANEKMRMQLAVYRMKREQGLGSLFGDEKLHHASNTDQQTDIRIVDEIILPTLNELSLTSCSEDLDQSRLNILQEALQNFLYQYGTKRVKKPTSRIYSVFKKPPAPLMKPRVSSYQEQYLEEQNNKKGSGFLGIVGVKVRKRNDSNTTDKTKGHHGSGSKRDKSARGQLPVVSLEPMKPVKVGTEALSQSWSNLGASDVDDRNSAHLKRADRSSESLYNPNANSKETPALRPKSMQTDDWLIRGRAHTVNTVPSPLIHPVLNDNNNPFLNNDVSDDVADVSDNSTALRTHRRRRDDENRHSLGSSNSNSDPDKNKVLQAVVNHSASGEQPELPFRQHTLSTTESTLSLNIEDRKLLEYLPTFQGDPEIDIDATEPQWTDLVPKSVTEDLGKKEIKRQQIINELIHTERHHVRDMKVLEKLFYEKFLTDGMMSQEEVQQMFPNLKEILNLHRELCQALVELKKQDGHVIKEIGDVLLSRFDGEGGIAFKNECARYCGNQSAVLSTIKEKSKKDPTLKQFLQVAQKHQHCRKFHLKDFIPLEFLRLTKYPLLLENIAKNTKKKQDAEVEKVKQAVDRSREILAYVNQTVKEAEDKQKIFEIQQSLDREPLLKLRNASSVIQEFKDIDLTLRPVIYHGPLTWRIGLMEKRKAIPLHCILYEDVLVLLQKQDDRYVLKCQGTQADKSTRGTHAPFIKIDAKLIVRNVATDKRAFFAMPTLADGPQMYQFAASGGNETKQWMKQLTDAAARRKDAGPGSVHRSVTASEPAGNLIGRAADDVLSQDMTALPTSDDYAVDEISSSSQPGPDTVDILNEISVKHQEIREAMSVKFRLLAEMLGLDENNMESILDISAADSNPDTSALITHSILCVDKLTGLLNESATPEASFVKSRNQSNVDMQSLNRLSVEIPESNAFQSEAKLKSPADKWAIPVPPPSGFPTSPFPPNVEAGDSSLTVVDESVTDEGISLQIDSNVEETFSADSQLPSDSVPKTLDDAQSAPATYPTTAENPEFPTENFEWSSENSKFLTDNPESLPENSELLLENPDLHPEKADFSSENAYFSSENAAVEPDRSAEANTNPDNASLDSVAVLPAEVPPIIVETNDARAVSDDTSDHSKSRPLSGVDICAQTSDVPVGRLMEIVMTLQTQLTQLMKINEERDDELRRLRVENKQLEAKIEKKRDVKANTDDRQQLPSYNEALQQGGPRPTLRMTSSTPAPSSLARDCAVVRASFLHQYGVVEPIEDSPASSPSQVRVTRRSTGF